MFNKYRSITVAEARMRGRAVVVLDVGKTLSKLSLWTPEGQQIAYCSRANDRIDAGAYVALDADGIEQFLADSLSSFARIADVGAIIPVGHGAAAAIVDSRGLVLPPLDYEHPIPSGLRREYDAERDPFALTGSPALPDGLNLGAQLYYLQATNPELFGSGMRILPWAQYWSWLLSGVASSEVTSLGCHTDLWRPLARTPSDLSVRRGWSQHIAPLQPAGAVVGLLTPEWVQRTGLPRDVEVHCGLHDSNAALVAARGFAEIAGNEATVLSTGTWFVAMRTPAAHTPIDIAALDEKRDCLVNVDAFGKPIPSARFMGGREIELLTGLDTRRIDIRPDQPALLSNVSDVLASDATVLPTLAPGSGPFPHGRGRWISMPDNEGYRRTAVCLYAALVADAALGLVGAKERLLIEGRFSESEVFVRALASLRPDMRVYVSHARSDVSFGALRLLNPELRPAASLVRVMPLSQDLGEYRQRWRQEAERMERASA
jgi:sugar (pentulose or hexulose) kinase